MVELHNTTHSVINKSPRSCKHILDSDANPRLEKWIFILGKTKYGVSQNLLVSFLKIIYLLYRDDDVKIFSLYTGLSEAGFYEQIRVGGLKLHKRKYF